MYSLFLNVESANREDGYILCTTKSKQTKTLHQSTTKGGYEINSCALQTIDDMSLNISLYDIACEFSHTIKDCIYNKHILKCVFIILNNDTPYMCLCLCLCGGGLGRVGGFVVCFFSFNDNIT